ncbi:hypothetical protein ACFFIX_27200 [Metabacillus herbersteinensis]|uniref:Uncharacterized protein n=1 Tax=Metabacillus herbersteinensis TaxID=283816 RepID=A0ABV6GN82_9BACI
MKKVLRVILTMLIEIGVLWGISIVFQLNLLEILFLAGVVIFAILWLFQFSSNQSQNQYIANIKGVTWQDAGGIKLYRFLLSPITLGFSVVYMFNYFLLL